VAFVNIRFGDIERGLSEEDARFVANQLRARGSGSDTVASELAKRIEQQAEAGTFAAPALDLELDQSERDELIQVLDALDLDVQLMGHVRSLRSALRGERWPGEIA
jgi:hypothetical protein